VQPSKDCLLDIGVANLIARNDPVALQRLAIYNNVLVPDIVIGELYYGAYHYAAVHHSPRLLNLYDNLRNRHRGQLIHANEDTAIIYGAIAADLRSKGQLIQQNDMWIAALARQYQLRLLTLDSDYQRVIGLDLDVW